MLKRAIGSMCLVLALVACKREHQPLEVRERCETPEVVACLQEYAYVELSSRDIERLANEGIEKCFSKDEEERYRQLRCLSLRMGRDVARGADVEITFHCSAMAPEACGVIPVYQVDLAECCRLKGRPCCPGRGYSTCLVPEFDVPPGALPTDAWCSLADDQK